MTVLLPRSKTWPPPPGAWLVLLKCEGGRSVHLTCGKCGKQTGTLADHTIAADGTVTPSIGCPHDGYDWHIFGVLEGWAEAIA